MTYNLELNYINDLNGVLYTPFKLKEVFFIIINKTKKIHDLSDCEIDVNCRLFDKLIFCLFFGFIL